MKKRRDFRLQRVSRNINYFTLANHMFRLVYIPIAATLIALLSGCLGLNDVLRVSEPGYAPPSDRAIVIVGVGMEGEWKELKFQIALQEYDMRQQSITGNCWRWNRVVAVTEKEIEYFVFDVAPGFYAGGGGTTVFRGQASPLAFEVPADRVVYLGDFVYARDHKLDLRRDVTAVKEALRKSFSEVVGEPVVAKTISVPTIQGFLCAP